MQWHSAGGGVTAARAACCGVRLAGKRAPRMRGGARPALCGVGRPSTHVRRALDAPVAADERGLAAGAACRDVVQRPGVGG